MDIDRGGQRRWNEVIPWQHWSTAHQLTETIQKGKQTNKQTSGGSMCGGADAGGGAELCSMRSLVCNASEYVEELQRCIGKEWSLICRVILWHHPPSKRVLPIVGDPYGVGQGWRGNKGGNLAWCWGHWPSDRLGATHYQSLAIPWTSPGNVGVGICTWSLQLTQPHTLHFHQQGPDWGMV